MDVTNTAEIFADDTFVTPIESASATFAIADDNTLTMTKTVDRPDEIYFPGETITFSITITNNSAAVVSGLVFRDVVDASIEPLSGTEFNVTTTSGTVTSSSNPIVVSDINIAPGSTIVITITGRIA